jgi:hypothetical protein
MMVMVVVRTQSLTAVAKLKKIESSGGTFACLGSRRTAARGIAIEALTAGDSVMVIQGLESSRCLVTMQLDGSAQLKFKILPA